MGLVVKADKKCYELYGCDLGGCSTQENEGCGRCSLAIKTIEKAPCGKETCENCNSYPCDTYFNTNLL